MTTRRRTLLRVATGLGLVFVMYLTLVAVNSMFPPITEAIFPESWYPALFELRVIGLKEVTYYDNGRVCNVTRWMPRKDRPHVRGSGRYYAYGKWECFSVDGKERFTLVWPGATGKWAKYSNKGDKLTEMEFKDGKQAGLETSWYFSGQKECEQEYDNGMKNGRRTMWWDNGQKCFEKYFRNDEPHGKCTQWYENGNVAREGFYDMGKQVGTWKSYSPDGKLAATLEWPNATGRWVEWYMGARERRRREEDYVNGELHGRRSMYEESSGRLLEEQWWENGKLVKKVVYE